MNRAERRRNSRAHQKEPVLIAGDDIVAADLGTQFEARPSADLEPKVPGKHRYVAIAAYVMSDEQAQAAHDKDTPKLLNNERLMSLSIGCYDCEEPLRKTANTTCPAS